MSSCFAYIEFSVDNPNVGQIQTGYAKLKIEKIKVSAEDIHLGVIITEVVIRKEMWNSLHNRAQAVGLGEP